MDNSAYEDPLGFGGEQADKVFKDQLKEIFELNMSIAKIFKGKDGERVLKWLVSVAKDLPTWSPSLARENYDAAIANGFAREGQIALVRDIQNRIATAKLCKSPDDLYELMKGTQENE